MTGADLGKVADSSSAPGFGGATVAEPGTVADLVSSLHADAPAPGGTPPRRPGPDATMPPFLPPAAPVDPRRAGRGSRRRSTSKGSSLRGLAALAKTGIVLPARRVVMIALAGGLGAGAMMGLVIGVVSPGTDVATRVADASSPGATNPGAGATSAPASPRATAAATPKSSVTTVIGSADVPPTQFFQQPWNDPTMQIVTLEDVKQGDNGVSVKVKRARFLMGDAAHRWYDSKGKDQQDVAVESLGGHKVTYQLRNDAAIYGQYLLGDHNNVEPKQLTLDDFVGAAQDALNNGDHPAIWLKHSNNIQDAPVIYLAEQYVP